MASTQPFSLLHYISFSKNIFWATRETDKQKEGQKNQYGHAADCL